MATPKAKLPLQAIEGDDGTFTVNYVPETAGEHVFDIKLNGHPIKDSPHSVKVIKPNYWVKCNGAGLESAKAEEEAIFYVDVKSNLGCRPTADESKLAIRITRSSDSAVVPHTISESGDIADREVNRFEVRYTPPTHGLYLIDVRSRGKILSGSPFKVRVPQEGVGAGGFSAEEAVPETRSETVSLIDDDILIEEEESSQRTKKVQDEEDVTFKFSFNNGKKVSAKFGELKTFTVSMLNGGRMVEPRGLIEVVTIDSNGVPHRPRSCLYNSFKLVVIQCYAPDDGELSLVVYYDGVRVDDIREYPTAGLAGVEPRTQVKPGEIDDSPFRIPVGTADENEQDRLTRLEKEKQRQNELQRQKEAKEKADAEKLAELQRAQHEKDKKLDEALANTVPKVPGLGAVKPENPKGNSPRGPSPREKSPRDDTSPRKKKKAGDLKVTVEYPEKQLLPNMGTTISISLKDKQTGEYIYEPGAHIEARVEGPNGEMVIPAEKTKDMGVYHIRFAPNTLGKYKSMVFFNGQKVQEHHTKIKCVSKLIKGKVGVRNPLDLLPSHNKN